LRNVFVAGPADINVKGRDDLKSLLLESPVLASRPDPDFPHPPDDRLETVGSEEIGDHGGQLLDIVAETAGAELPEIGEVLAKLRGFDASRLGQRLAGNGAGCGLI